MKFTIPGRLPGLNEYIDAERVNKYKAAQLKREAETLVILSARRSLHGWKAKGPVMMYYFWVEKDRRRDKDNISGYGRKVIQDALVRAGYLKGDGWAHIAGFADDFSVDKKKPRIEVVLEEVQDYE